MGGGRWEAAGARKAAEGGLQRRDATAVGRVAKRAAQVVAESERRHAGRQRRGLATARTTGGEVGRPGVAGEAVEWVVRADPQPQLGQVRACQRDRSGGLHALDHRGVDRRHRFGEGRHALGGGRAGAVQVLLDGERHAVEGPQGSAGRHSSIGGVCAGPGTVGQHANDRVEVSVHLVDPGKVGVDHLPAGGLAAGDHRRQLVRCPSPQFVNHGGIETGSTSRCPPGRRYRRAWSTRRPSSVALPVPVRDRSGRPRHGR